MSLGSTASLVEAWVRGWAVSRGAAEPAARPWGFTVDVGQALQATRHVLTATDEATVREVAAATAAPTVWLKVFADPASVRRWAGPEWREDGPGWLMSSPCDTAPAPASPRATRCAAGGAAA
ncbi:hypothetical protein ACRAR1_08745 [Streptomyces sanyensis]|uniref:hypothetical protein n=1 Tax=Streptomyces sanyensis TaxID=568869 RepID=UPI003D7881B0